MEYQIQKSVKIQAGNRSYCLEINKLRDGMDYLVIEESQKDDFGEFKHNRVVVLQEYFPIILDELVKLAPELSVKLNENSVIAEIRKLSPKAYTSWTKKEDEQLEEFFCQGKTPNELAEIFQRQVGAITSRISKLELREKYSK